MGKPPKNYLKRYNLVQFLGWTSFFLLSVINNFNIPGFPFLLLLVFQIAAILEILHARLSWVRSSVLTTFIQVFSRVAVVLILFYLFYTSLSSKTLIWGVSLITLAWGITEMVRYSFYFSQLMSWRVKPLSWMRYHFFMILYPMGVLGELLIIWSLIESFELVSWLQIVLFSVLVLIYLIFFPKMFGHMLKQRRNYLRNSE